MKTENTLKWKQMYLNNVIVIKCLYCVSAPRWADRLSSGTVMCVPAAGPDFRKLSQLSQVLSDTPVPLSASLLDDYSSAALQDECRTIMQQLQELGLFTQARTVAQLAELPIDCLIINEVRDRRANHHRNTWLNNHWNSSCGSVVRALR